VIRPVTVTVRFGSPVDTMGMTIGQRDQLAAAVRGSIEALLAKG
jgi:hypothetical protein